MAYDAVILIVGATSLVFGIMSGITLTLMRVNRDTKQLYENGWNDAKKIYYTDIKKEREREHRAQLARERKIQEEIEKANEDFNPISADLLMAYGVSSVGQLPKQVREAYNITDGRYDHIDVDSYYFDSVD